MRIIAVDDEMEALSNFLLHIIDNKQIEYKFFMANPLDAIDYTRQNPVEGAFLDIRMPVIDGVSLAEKLIKLNPNIKIVFITGYAYNEDAIRERLGDNLLGFCYKPFDPEKLNRYISEIMANGKREIRFRTFGPFDILLNGQPLHFSSTKAKELLAVLVTYRGSVLTMSDAIYHLWPDHPLDPSKELYRDAVWRLRKVLKDAGISDIISFEKGKTALRMLPNISADIWDFEDGKNNDFHGVFLPNYDWTADTELTLEEIKKDRMATPAEA